MGCVSLSASFLFFVYSFVHYIITCEWVILFLASFSFFTRHYEFQNALDRYTLLSSVHRARTLRYRMFGSCLGHLASLLRTCYDADISSSHSISFLFEEMVWFWFLVDVSFFFFASHKVCLFEFAPYLHHFMFFSVFKVIFLLSTFFL